MRYELSINILDKKYVDTLIIGLVRQGYSVYYTMEWGSYRGRHGKA